MSWKMRCKESDFFGGGLSKRRPSEFKKNMAGAVASQWDANPEKCDVALVFRGTVLLGGRLDAATIWRITAYLFLASQAVWNVLTRDRVLSRSHMRQCVVPWHKLAMVWCCNHVVFFKHKSDTRSAHSTVLITVSAGLDKKGAQTSVRSTGTCAEPTAEGSVVGADVIQRQSLFDNSIIEEVLASLLLKLVRAPGLLIASSGRYSDSPLRRDSSSPACVPEKNQQRKQRPHERHDSLLAPTRQP